MPTTRGQAQKNSTDQKTKTESKPVTKRHVSEHAADELPKKRTKRRESEVHSEDEKEKSNKVQDHHSGDFQPETGVIERGHIYFFYRIKVQQEQAESIDDVKNLHILLVPRLPAFALDESSVSEGKTGDNRALKDEESSDSDMTLLEPGVDAVPAPADHTQKKKYRLITVGKKKLPGPVHGGAGKGRKETFWTTVTRVGEDLDQVEKGLDQRSYETKTRGTRHEEPARLLGRGAYAIVNNNPSVPSKRTTHLGYHLSHPSPSDMGDVQASLGIQQASSFIVQVKNPLASSGGPGQGFAAGKGAEYPEWIMDKIFGKNGQKGREDTGLRFVSCETTKLLDYEGAQLLLIAGRGGEDGLEASLGSERGNALTKAENKESSKSVDEVFKELGLDQNAFTADAINGQWI